MSDDELAYLLPSLHRRRPAAETQSGPVSYLTRVLIARAQSTARKVAQVSGDTQSVSDVLEHFIASGLLISVAADQMSEQAHASSDFEPIFDRAGIQSSHDRHGAADWLVGELTTLAYADRMLKDALDVKCDAAEATPLVDWPLSLADVFVATASTRLNGAYVYPEYDWAHEILSLAAVMGHLVQGRTVYLPPFLAETLIDTLAGQRQTADAQVVSVLRTYAELAGGVDFLVKRAKVISALGVARRVSPRPAAVAREGSRWSWNGRLLKRIDERHCWPMQRAA